MKFLGIIPARYASTRFPGKPLAMIGDTSMIMRVYARAVEARCFAEVAVATDDARIYEHVLAEGGKAIMTSNQHPSGTDRVNEAMNILLGDNNAIDDHVVINIQGDEPFIDPKAIITLSETFNKAEIGIATLIKKITSQEELSNPNVVKVVVGKSGQALYFSRSPLPHARNVDLQNWLSDHSYYKHIGIYAYRAEILRSITRLEPSPLELSEGLEQLRWLENGFAIYTEVTDYESIAVDTPADLSKITNKA